MLRLLFNFKIGTLRRVDFFAVFLFLGIVAKVMDSIASITPNLYDNMLIQIVFIYFALLLTIRRLRDIGATIKLLLIYPAVAVMDVLILTFPEHLQTSLLPSYITSTIALLFFLYLLFKKGKSTQSHLNKGLTP